MLIVGIYPHKKSHPAAVRPPRWPVAAIESGNHYSSDEYGSLAQLLTEEREVLNLDRIAKRNPLHAYQRTLQHGNYQRKRSPHNSRTLENP